MELLAEVAQDPSRAVLAVTHDHRTLGYADRIIRIEDGLIVVRRAAERQASRRVGVPQTIITSPLLHPHRKRIHPAPP